MQALVQRIHIPGSQVLFLLSAKTSRRLLSHLCDEGKGRREGTGGTKSLAESQCLGWGHFEGAVAFGQPAQPARPPHACCHRAASRSPVLQPGLPEGAQPTLLLPWTPGSFRATLGTPDTFQGCLRTLKIRWSM